jgi:hypothetical protein
MESRQPLLAINLDYAQNPKNLVPSAAPAHGRWTSCERGRRAMNVGGGRYRVRQHIPRTSRPLKILGKENMRKLAVQKYNRGMCLKYINPGGVLNDS